jgi:flagellar export protein FliJ
MKAFRFTLEAVQTVRHRQEQQAMENYVRALLARRQALDHVESIREQIRRNQQELSLVLTTGGSAARAAQACQYERSLEKTLTERATTLALADRRVHATMQAMLLARQKLQAVETYRAKQKARHSRDETREEQKLLDDLASRRARSLFAWNPSAEAL